MALHIPYIAISLLVLRLHFGVNWYNMCMTVTQRSLAYIVLSFISIACIEVLSTVFHTVTNTVFHTVTNTVFHTIFHTVFHTVFRTVFHIATEELTQTSQIVAMLNIHHANRA